jgi:hypothetical protein
MSSSGFICCISCKPAAPPCAASWLGCIKNCCPPAPPTPPLPPPPLPPGIPPAPPAMHSYSSSATWRNGSVSSCIDETVAHRPSASGIRRWQRRQQQQRAGMHRPIAPSATTGNKTGRVNYRQKHGQNWIQKFPELSQILRSSKMHAKLHRYDLMTTGIPIFAGKKLLHLARCS